MEMTVLLVFVSLIYIAVLFFIAQWGDKQGERYNLNPQKKSLPHHPIIYSLALGIYCTSWTYFGAVGTAATGGWQFLPILLGPLLLVILGHNLLHKLVVVSKKQHITSIADFISARYGKRQQTALIVTIILSMAVIPYIALQLKAINASFTAFSVTDSEDSFSNLKALFAICMIGLFAVLYGARKSDITEYRAGLMLAIAFESLLKLFGILVSAALAFLFISEQGQITEHINIFNHSDIWQFKQMLSFDFAVQTLMAAAAFLCLPRQFHVMVVDNASPKQLKTSRWLFPLYLLLTILAIVPIAIVGNTAFSNTGINQDTYIMQLPLLMENSWAAVFVFVGGLSAATAMIIVATLTLSTMITNDVIVPFVLKREKHNRSSHKHTNRESIIKIRRITIGMILLMAFTYYHLWTGHAALHSIGLIAFSLVIQLLPAIIGGLYWKRGHAYGVYAGLLLGFISWLMFLLMPLAFAGDGSTPTPVITQGVLISLGFNLIGYIGLSLLSRERLVDRIQATAFVEPNLPNDEQFSRAHRTQAQVQDLQDLLSTFLGDKRQEDLLNQYQESNEKLDPSSKPSAEFIRYCERALSGALGSSSARSLINVVLSRKQLDIEQVVNFFDDTTQAIKTNQEILFNSIESIDQGISVIDPNLNLVAWNKRYLEMFDYPENLMKVGQPIASLIKYNAERGECGFGDIDELVNKRLQYMQQAKPHHYIRQRSDGRVIEMIGNPLPNGGLVTSFTDITTHIETQKALKTANIDLKKKVADRKAEISDITQAFKHAKLEAEQANQSKTRFLALASHDILQPLNAARLYLSALDEKELNEKQHNILAKTDLSLQATEELISTLLEIAKLEQGALKPNLTHFKLSNILQPLCDEYRNLAELNSLTFSQHWQDYVIESDATYLRRILQNFMSNAVKYTERGKVLVGVRKTQQQGKPAVRIEIWDNGPGIAAEAQEKIFSEFYRLHTGSISGVGLGLSVVQRMSQQLKCPLKVTSKSGKGSCFGVTIPLGNSKQVEQKIQPQQSDLNTFAGLRVLCIDDDLTNLDSLSTLLTKWRCQVSCLNNVEEALQYAETQGAPDIMIVDYQLSPSATTGLALIKQMQSIWELAIPAALVSAVKEPQLKLAAKTQGVTYIPKPVKPAVLKSWLKANT